MTDSPFPYSPSLSLRDNENHAPDSHPLWQESSLVCFCDPAAGLAGFHRIGLHPNKNEASIYSWTQIGGELVSCAKRTGLALPEGPTTNTELEGVRFTTLDPLMRYRYQVERDGVSTDVEFKSFTGPVQLTLDIGGAVVAPGHYNMLGSVRGAISANGQRHAFDGVGFQDHSWGPRDGSKILGHRWIMAVFDAKNMACVIPTFGPNGAGAVGYVMLNGELAPLRAARTRFNIADDNLRIEACSASIEDALGRTIELTGEAAGADSLQPYGQGYFAVHSPATFAWEGRRGIGYLEWSPMRGVPAARRDKLGITADNDWLKASSTGGAA